MRRLNGAEVVSELGFERQRTFEMKDAKSAVKTSLQGARKSKVPNAVEPRTQLSGSR